MREIKFRAWDRQNKCWIDIYSIKFEKDGSIIAITALGKDDIGHYGLHQVELVQYTGLKDKNGVEIYEGDIVSILNNDTELAHTKGWIVYYEEAFGFAIKHRTDCDKSGVCYTALYYPDNIEVIGNTYENEELMEEQK